MGRNRRHIRRRIRAAADIARRSASSLAKGTATLLGQIEVRTAGAVFGWLVGVVAFALVFPIWVTGGLLALALVSATIWGSHRRLRAAVWAIVFVALTTTTAYLVSSLNLLNSDASSGKGSVASWRPIALGLDAKLEAKNRTYGHEWATTLDADGNDELQFRLTIRNTRPTPSPTMIVRIVASGPESHPRLVGLEFGNYQYGPFAPGPQVKVIPQSQGLNRFYGEELVLGNPSSTAPELESLGGYTLEETEDENESGFEWMVPSIPAHRTLAIGFLGSYGTPDSAVLDAGPIVKMKNLTHGEGAYKTTVAAKSGDRLSVGIELHNSGFREMDFFGRVGISAHDHGRFDRIAMHVTEAFEHTRELGHGTVNSSTGQPIALTVLPGTTELVGPRTKCSKERRSPLPDGIDEGGVDLGAIGGFQPRDPCLGSELTRVLEFEAVVGALKTNRADSRP